MNSDKNKWLSLMKTFQEMGKGNERHIILTDEWFNKVEKAQIEIRKFFGGVNKSFQIELKDQVNRLSSVNILLFNNQILKYLPNYYSFHNFPADIIACEYFQLSYSNARKGSRVSSHIIKYMSEILKIDELSDTYSEVKKILAKLGQEWALLKTKVCNINAIFSTDPVAYSLLGNYGCDDGSCFGQGRERNTNKYFLGQTPNSFVLLLTNDNISEVSENRYMNPENICRCWGFSFNNNTEIQISNYYPKKGEIEGNLHNAIVSASFKLFGVESSEDIVVNGRKYNIRNIYHNGTDGYKRDWHIHKKSEKLKPYDSPDFNCNTEQLTIAVSCGFCKQACSAKIRIDSLVCCSECEKKANICEETKTLTMQKLIQVNTLGGKNKVNIHPNRLDHYFMCSNTKQYYDVKDRIELDGHYVSIFSVDPSKHKKCEVCRKMNKVENLKQILDIGLGCKTCAEIIENKSKIEERFRYLKNYYENELKIMINDEPVSSFAN